MLVERERVRTGKVLGFLLIQAFLLVFCRGDARADVDATGRWVLHGCSSVCEIEDCFTCAGEPSTCLRLDPGTVGEECDPQCEIRYGAGGTITDFETGQPIAGALVTVSTEGGANTAGTTEADGSYSVGGSTTVRCFIDYRVDLRIRAAGYYEARRTGYFSTAYMGADIQLTPWLAGDCDLDRSVDVSELVVGLQILLGRESLEQCAALDVNRDGRGDLFDLVKAIRQARGVDAARSNHVSGDETVLGAALSVEP